MTEEQKENAGIFFKIEKEAKIHYLAATDKQRVGDTLKQVFLTVLNIKGAPEPFASLNGQVVAVATDGFMLGIQPIDIPAEHMIEGGVTIPAYIWKELVGHYVTIRTGKDDQGDKTVQIQCYEKTWIVPNIRFVDFSPIIKQAKKLKRGAPINIDIKLVRRIVLAYPSSSHITLSPTSTKSDLRPIVFDFYYGDGCGAIMPVTERRK